MSSHGFEVPHGWKRGEPLKRVGSGPVTWALGQGGGAGSPATYGLNPEHVGVITFSSRYDRNKFVQWWFEGKEIKVT